MSVNCTSLGKRISFYRSKSNLSQEALAAKSTVAVNTLSVSKMEQKSLAFLFLSKLPTPYPFPRMSFCSTVLNILLPLQTPNFTACCWTVMKLNRLSLFAWQKS